MISVSETYVKVFAYRLLKRLSPVLQGFPNDPDAVVGSAEVATAFADVPNLLLSATPGDEGCSLPSDCSAPFKLDLWSAKKLYCRGKLAS